MKVKLNNVKCHNCGSEDFAIKVFKSEPLNSIYCKQCGGHVMWYNKVAFKDVNFVYKKE